MNVMLYLPLRQDIAAKTPVEFRVSLLAFYLTNFFYEEALSVLERDAEVTEFLRRQGCNVAELTSLLQAVL